jgi:hypothetical protein
MVYDVLPLKANSWPEAKLLQRVVAEVGTMVEPKIVFILQ